MKAAALCHSGFDPAGDGAVFPSHWCEQNFWCCGTLQSKLSPSKRPAVTERRSPPDTSTAAACPLGEILLPVNLAAGFTCVCHPSLTNRRTGFHCLRAGRFFTFSHVTHDIHPPSSPQTGLPETPQVPTIQPRVDQGLPLLSTSPAHCSPVHQ